MLSIVCPVYNEAENIQSALDQIQNNISLPCVEVLIVYDDCDDNTIPVVRRISSQYSFSLRLIRNQFGRGALNAIKTGFNTSQYNSILVVMADVSDDLSLVDDMYKKICDDDYDVVCGSRYMPGGKQIGGPLLKRWLSRWAGVSLHYFTGIPTHDVTNSFKMYRKELIESIQIQSSGGFEIGMEIVVKAFVAGKKITQMPTTWNDRAAGESRFQMWKWLPHYLRWYFYAFRAYIRKKEKT